MRQNINLYQPQFRPEQRIFPAKVALVATVLMIVAMFSIYGFAAKRVAGVQSELDLAASLETAALERLQGLRPLIAAVTGETSWSQRLDETIAAIHQKQTVLDLVKGTQFGDLRGFSRHLRALGQQEIEGLWLTRIALSGRGDSTRLEGMAVRPELVPIYVQQLTETAPFAEQGFQRFRIESPEERGEGPVAFSMDSQIELDAAAKVHP